jgi:hypothetical protein
LKRVATLSHTERAELFEATSEKRGLDPVIVEKDFWVCWTLERLFSLPVIAPHLLFKGGTTLSKVYGVIERFSEDIDLSLSRDFLGFGGEKEPEKATSGTQKRKRIEELKEAFAAAMSAQVAPALRLAITDTIGDSGWELLPSPLDPGTLDFQYPRSLPADNPYIRPSVKIEMGGRNDTWPSETHTITSYVAEEFPDIFTTPEATVRVLAVERTFWEKATLLHDEYHRPAERSQGERISRHYYDMAMLARRADITEKALGSPELLKRVTEHKELFYRYKWSRYDEATPGTFRLLPPEFRLAGLRSDYQAMSAMFFEGAIPFEEILSEIQNLEEQINSRGKD